MSHLKLSGLHKTFGQFHAIRGVDLTIERGEFCALLGPSGCGKSTLLRLIAGLEEVTAGQIEIAGRDVTDLESSKRQIAMVFQPYALYPHMSVADNIAFSLEVQGMPKADRHRRAAEIAGILHLTELLDRKPAELSGGQRQRVAIGRALVRAPEVFLFDEPLSNLDALLRVQMRIELADLHREIGATMVYVTHDQIEAMTMADRIVVLDEGAVQQVGSPLELYDRPANRFVAGFIGSPAMSFIPVTAGNGGEGRQTVVLGGREISVQTRHNRPVAGGAAAELGIRPEHCRLGAEAAAGIAGRVHIVERLGNQTIVHVDTEAGPVTVQGPPHLAAEVGAGTFVAIDTDQAHLFGQDGLAA